MFRKVSDICIIYVGISIYMKKGRGMVILSLKKVIVPGVHHERQALINNGFLTAHTVLLKASYG